jgi:ketosteroid isomerase-like protein
MSSVEPRGEALVDRVTAAVNGHDLDALVSCFAEDYRNETPPHPGRSFVGRAQVRRNWAQLFSAVPDLRATVTDRCGSGPCTWSEWDLAGNRIDGTAARMRGVVIFTESAGVASAARFYLEPVEDRGDTVDDAVRAIAAPTSPSGAGS